jgi:hypothetical protein
MWPRRECQSPAVAVDEGGVRELRSAFGVTVLDTLLGFEAIITLKLIRGL